MEKIEYKAFEPDEHLSGILEICRRLEWDNFRYDPDLTRKSLAAPGVTALIAVAREPGEVVGFAQVFGDGVGLQTHLSLLAVDEKWRRKGVAKSLVKKAFERFGAERMDLASS
ncbi:MAG: GNAT family N-acetyltransferase, partial [Rubrobacteraceae bacterium]